MDENTTQTELSEVPESPAQRSTREATFRWLQRMLLRLFLGFCLTLTGLYFLLYFHLNPYIKDSLIAAVHTHTDSLYILNIDQLNVSLFDANISVREIEIKKNPQRWQEILKQKEDESHIDLALRVGELEVENIQWINFIRTHEIHIDKIKLFSPKIKFKNHQAQDTNRVSRATDQQVVDFFEKISKGFRLDKFEIVDADVSFHLFTDQGEIYHQGDSINLALMGIEIAKANQKRPIALENFELSFKDYSFNTPDQVYNFSSENLHLSSLDSVFRIENLKIEPASMLKVNQIENIQNYQGTHFQVQSEFMEITGLDFNRALYQQEFDLKTLEINGLDLYIEQDQRLKASLDTLPETEAAAEAPPLAEGSEQDAIKNLLRDLPFYLRMDTLSLQHSSLEFRQKNAGRDASRDTYHKIDSINLSFQYLALGRAIDQQSSERALFSKNVDLSIKNYTFRTPNGVYEFFMEGARVSSLDSVIQVENAYLKPLISPQAFSARTYYQQMLIDARVGKLTARNLDIERFAYQQEFALGAIHLEQPTFKAYLDKRKAKRPSQEYQNFEEVLQSIPLFIEVDTLSIQQASVDYHETVALEESEEENGVNHHQVANIDLQIFNIQLGHALDRPALAEIDTKNLRMSLADYRLQTANGYYQVSLDRIDISSLQSYISIDSLSVKPLISSEEFSEKIRYQGSLLDISIDNIRGQEIDFRRLLMYQEIDWGGLSLQNPRLNIYTDKTKPKRPKPPTLQDSLVVDSLISQWLAYYDFYDVVVDSLTREEALALLLDENEQEDSISKPIWDTIPREDLIINGTVSLAENQRVLMAQLENRNLTDTTGLRRLLREIPFYIKIDTLSVNQANVIYQEKSFTKQATGLSYHIAEDINFVVPQIRIGKATEDSTFQQFYSGNILFTLGGYLYRDKNNVFNLSLRNIQSSLEDSVLLIEELRYLPLLSPEEFVAQNQHRSTHLQADLKSIQANAIDIDRLVFDQEFVVNSLFVNQPHLQLYTDLNKPPKPGIKPKTAEEILRSIPIYIDIDTFALNEASLYYNIAVPRLPGDTKLRLARHRVEHINLFARKTKLALDKSSRALEEQEKLLYSESIQLSLRDYEFITPDSLYRIALDRLSSSLQDSSVYVQNLRYEPLLDKAAFDRANTYRKTRFDLAAQDLRINNIDFKRLVRNEGYHLQSLALENVQLDIYDNALLPSRPNAKARTPEELLAEIPNFIEIDTLSLKNAALNYEQKINKGQGVRTLNHTADSIDVTFYQLRLDSATTRSQNDLLFCKDIQLRLKNYQTHTPDSLYGIRVKEAKASSRQSFIEIDEFKVRPTIYNDSLFVIAKGGYQTERYRMDVEQVYVDQIDFRRLINQKELFIESLAIKSLNADIYRDKTFVKDSTFRPKMPQNSFRKIPLKLVLDTLKIADSRLNYGEKVTGGVGIGEVFFTELNLTAHDIDTRAAPEDTTTIFASARLMNQGLLDATIKFPLRASKLYCRYYGELGEMKAGFFNSIIERNEHIRISKGFINRVKYQVELNDTLATGTLAAGYRRLRIQVLREEDHEKKKSFLTFLANLIINNRNILDKRKAKTGEVYYIRKEEDSFFKALWKSLSTGLVDTLK